MPFPNLQVSLKRPGNVPDLVHLAQYIQGYPVQSTGLSPAWAHLSRLFAVSFS
jgi:hypothetical protein